jgi:hypothetical protein
MAKTILSSKQLEILRLVILAEAGEQVELDRVNVTELCDLGLVEKGPENSYRLSFAGLRFLQEGSRGNEDDSA